MPKRPRLKKLPDPPVPDTIRPFDASRYLDEPERLDDDPNAGARKRGRPPILLANKATLKVVQGLGQIWATYEEVAAVLGVTHVAIVQWFEREPAAKFAYDTGYQNGRISFRRDQRNLAKSNGSVAIFLGKNHLGQKDVIELGGKLDVNDVSESAKQRLLRKLGGRAQVTTGAGAPADNRRLN